jgi:hypothetical protein
MIIGDLFTASSAAGSAISKLMTLFGGSVAEVRVRVNTVSYINRSVLDSLQGFGRPLVLRQRPRHYHQGQGQGRLSISREIRPPHQASLVPLWIIVSRVQLGELNRRANVEIQTSSFLLA